MRYKGNIVKVHLSFVFLFSLRWNTPEAPEARIHPTSHGNIIYTQGQFLAWF